MDRWCFMLLDVDFLIDFRSLRGVAEYDFELEVALAIELRTRSANRSPLVTLFSSSPALLTPQSRSSRQHEQFGPSIGSSGLHVRLGTRRKTDKYYKKKETERK